ncbi:hypothetical protein Tco_0211845, partial [Tanacetum coccineum]
MHANVPACEPFFRLRILQSFITHKDLYNVRWSADIVVKDIDMDSHKHLFFKCEYVEEFWNTAMSKMGVNYEQMDRNDLVTHIASLYCRNSINSVIRILELAACVYLIWQEENLIILRDEKRSSTVLAKVFSKVIRMGLLILKVKKSIVVLRVQKRWS